MNSLRVAIYHNLHSGGAKRVLMEHARRLATKHRVSLFSLSSADHTFANDDRSQVPVSLLDYHRLPMARSPFGRINPIVGMLNVMRLDALSRQLATLIDGQSFDVVLVHPCQVTQAPLLLRWLRTPTLYYCHELPRKLYESPVARPYLSRSHLRRSLDSVDPLPVCINTWLRRLDRQSAQRATRIVTNSHFSQNNVVAAYGRPADICYPCVDADVFQPTWADREPFVLSVGALTPAKGFDFVIQALGTLSASERPRLVIISNYQESEELRYLTALAQQQQVEAEFHTGVTEPELRAWYARAGCVAYAPIREPLGLVALETMAAGAPLVCVAEGGLAETVVHTVTGVLVPREPVIFGQAIRQLLAQPEYARQLGQAARRHVLEHWTWGYHMERLESILEQAACRALPSG